MQKKTKEKKKKILEEIVVRPKPWGREIWFAHTTQYAGKILEIKKGHRFSLQYHEKKWETQLLMQGEAVVTYGKNKKRLKKYHLKAGDKIDIPPYTIHRVHAKTDCIIFEVSTAELDDIVKLEDDYGRRGRGNNPALDILLSQ